MSQCSLSYSVISLTCCTVIRRLFLSYSWGFGQAREASLSWRLSFTLEWDSSLEGFKDEAWGTQISISFPAHFGAFSPLPSLNSVSLPPNVDCKTRILLTQSPACECLNRYFLRKNKYKNAHQQLIEKQHRIELYCMYRILLKSALNACLINILVWVSAIEKSRPSAKSQRAEICFTENKGVSESKGNNMSSEICFSFSK